MTICAGSIADVSASLQPTSITPIIYSVLQMISRGRDEGATAVRISKELGIEPKSVFHYLKVPQQLGIMFVRYLSLLHSG